MFIRFLFLVLFTAGLSANPFLGEEEDKTPEVRPPSSEGFMVETQIEFRNMLGEQLENMKEGDNLSLILPVLGLAFVYGLLHAAGPGHRKTVVFSVFLTRKAKWNEPLLAALLSAGVHGGTAVILILLFKLLFQSFGSNEIQDVSSWMEGISYIILILLSLLFFLRAVGELTGLREHSHHHGHGESKNIYATLAASSLFPCPGVIMIMTFSVVLGITGLGILAVSVLSLGMAFTISIAAYAAYLGRESLFLVFKKREHLIGKMSNGLESASYLFLLLFSLWMAWPFLRDLTGLFA